MPTVSLLFQGVGGSVHLPKGFLPKAYKLIRDHGGICISDEVSYKNLDHMDCSISLIIHKEIENKKVNHDQV